MALLENVSELKETDRKDKTEPADISETLKAVGAEAYLMHGARHDSDIYYATRFSASDPFSYLLAANGDEALLISEMEKGRADAESRLPAEKIKTLSDYNYRTLVKEQKNADAAYAQVLKTVLNEKDIRTVAVSYDFSAYFFDALQKQGLTVVLMKSPFEKARAVKTAEEIDKIAASQAAAEKAMAAAIEMIGRSSPDDTGSGKLVLDGRVLTGSAVLLEIARVLMENNCADEDTIISCGPDSANPHGKTDGALYANHPIVIDIFPQGKSTHYFGDMTRTVIRGDVSEELIRMYDAVKKAQEIGVQAAKPGVTCAEVHNAVCDSLEGAGYDTYRNGSKVGFIHTTGHGVGLDIHEMPSVSDNPHVLVPGNVITIEPGLYYPDIGGIRLEDTIVITEDGCKNLNRLPKIFEI